MPEPDLLRLGGNAARNGVGVVSGRCPAFIAKTALYCREKGHMKDMPALLTAVLSLKGREYFPAVFTRVIDNGKIWRTFVQIMRSGVVGRKSLGNRPKQLIQQWLNTASEKQLIDAAVGNTPPCGRSKNGTPTPNGRDA